MLNFDHVGSSNLDRLPTNSFNWVLAILLNLINFGSFCWTYINWVLANLDNFGSIWIILGHFSWIRIILFNFDQLSSCNFNKLCYILVTDFSLFCSNWSIFPSLNHFAQYWGVLLHIHQLGSHFFWLTASIWLFLRHFSWGFIISVNGFSLFSIILNHFEWFWSILIHFDVSPRYIWSISIQFVGYFWTIFSDFDSLSFILRSIFVHFIDFIHLVHLV